MLRWHYRGHGRSGLPRERERIGMLYTCDDLNRVMDAAGIDFQILSLFELVQLRCQRLIQSNAMSMR